MRFPMKYVYLVFPIMGTMFVLHCVMHIWDLLVGKADY
jgi:TRAP-type C4-dicarboxylate transport system permease small subunit